MTFRVPPRTRRRPIHRKQAKEAGGAPRAVARVTTMTSRRRQPRGGIHGPDAGRPGDRLARVHVPEQAAGFEVGPPSDIFSLGAVLAFAATGEGPFGTGTTAALLYRVVHGTPGLDRIPSKVRPLIERCLAKDPGQARAYPFQAGVGEPVDDAAHQRHAVVAYLHHLCQRRVEVDAERCGVRGHQDPAPAVDHDLVMEEAQQHAALGAGLAAVGLVPHVMDLARRRGLFPGTDGIWGAPRFRLSGPYRKLTSDDGR